MSAGQQLGMDMATNFMLMTVFSFLADASDNPDGFRTDIKKALCDLADNYNLPGLAPEIAQEARDAAKKVIAGVLQNPKSFKQH
jgi:hypothetical protein